MYIINQIWCSNKGSGTDKFFKFEDFWGRYSKYSQKIGMCGGDTEIYKHIAWSLLSPTKSI